MCAQQTAMITGATGGLGRALVDVFDAAGWGLIMTGSRAGELPIPLRNGHRYIRGDLRMKATMDDLHQAATRSGLDVLINCAGIRYGKPLTDTQPFEVEEEMDVNLAAPILLTRRMWDIFTRQGRGMVINIGSTAVHAPGKDEAIYAATKAGLLAFTRGIQQAATAIGVRALYVAPGAMSTDMTMGREDRHKFMDPRDVALALFDLCRAPAHSMRVTEITMQRMLY